MAHSIKKTITIGIDTLGAILRALDGDEALLRDLRKQKDVVGSPMHTLIEKYHQQQAWLSVKTSLSKLTADQFRRLYYYDPETGVITKKVRSNADHGEHVAIGALSNGYIRILIGKRLYFAHRLAFLYMTGQWPSQVVDHINGNRADNRFCNLRDVDQGTNVRNKGFDYVQNKLGFAGVSLDQATGKFRASVMYQNKKIRLGEYDTAEEAHSAYAEAKRKTRQGENPKRFLAPKSKGYCLDRLSGKYRAVIVHEGESIYLGQYQTEEEARLAYLKAKQLSEEGHRPKFREVQGYSYLKAKGVFSACIQKNNKSINLGNFKTAKEARSAYFSAKAKLDIGEAPIRNVRKVKGYSFNKQSGKFSASIRRKGTTVYLGLFDSADEAHAAYLRAAAELAAS